MTDQDDTLPATLPPLTNQQKRLLDQSLAIQSAPPDRTDFLHSVLCQVGLPRRATAARTFERQSGPFSILLEGTRPANHVGGCHGGEPGGVRLTWENLKAQFGQEYGTVKDFKREFRGVLRQVWLVYPSARISEEFGGVRLYESPPPIPKTTISLAVGTRDKPRDA